MRERCIEGDKLEWIDSAPKFDIDYGVPLGCILDPFLFPSLLQCILHLVKKDYLDNTCQISAFYFTL